MGPPPSPLPVRPARRVLCGSEASRAFAGGSWALRALRSLLVFCCSGCAMFMPAVTPMVTVDDDIGEKAKCLVILLPGVGDVATDFEARGFVDAVRTRGLSVDLTSAQATFSYYARGTVVERLHVDVVGPARKEDYRQIWLIGLSMGGLGALLYAHDHPGDITGVLALAPFLGTHPVSAKIHAEGGLARWQAPARVPVTDEDTTVRELWRWLQAVTAGKERAPALYLGWGVDDDLLGHTNEVLAEALPKPRRFAVPGGHEWTAWREALGLFLDGSDFTKGCGREVSGGPGLAKAPGRGRSRLR